MFRILTWEWNILFPNWLLRYNVGLFCSEFISVNGTVCSQFEWRKTENRARTDLFGQVEHNLCASHCHEFCTIVIGAGKRGHVWASSNMHEVPFCSLVPWFWLRYKGEFVKQMFLKEQNEQEVQSQLV